MHLFCGIGGFPLGMAWAGWTVGRSLVTGGFPCQDISVAGKGAGLDGERSGLFWEMLRVIKILQPDDVLGENVGALAERGLDRVADSLEQAGYEVGPLRVGAWAFGAPHERERWWLVIRRIGAGGVSVADTCAAGLRAIGKKFGKGAEPDQPSKKCDGQEVQPDTGGARRETRGGVCGDEEGPRVGWCESPRGDQLWKRVREEWQYAGPPVFVYRCGTGRKEQHAAAQPGGAGHAARRPDPTTERGWPVPVLPGFQQREWEKHRLYQRGVGDTVHGLPRRLADALNKCGVMALGNAVVPQVVAAIGRGIVKSRETRR